MPKRKRNPGGPCEGANAMNRRAFLTGAATVALSLAAQDTTFGQSFPSNVIRIVVPYSASTPPDILARIIATALSEGEGWNVIVENKPGAVGTIGPMEALKRPADGHTLLSAGRLSASM